MSKTIMNKCCGLYPYSRKGTLYLHPDRAADFAYQAENKYSDFVCHKTGVIHEDHPDENRQNEIVRGEKSLTCAGFYALQYNVNSNGDEKPKIVIDYEDLLKAA